jgi:hypothetical protein
MVTGARCGRTFWQGCLLTYLTFLHACFISPLLTHAELSASQNGPQGLNFLLLSSANTDWDLGIQIPEDRALDEPKLAQVQCQLALARG